MSSIPLIVAIFREVIERRLQAGKVRNSDCDYGRQRTERLSTFTLIASFLPFLLDMTDISRGITTKKDPRCQTSIIASLFGLPIFSGWPAKNDEMRL